MLLLVFHHMKIVWTLRKIIACYSKLAYYILQQKTVQNEFCTKVSKNVNFDVSKWYLQINKSVECPAQSVITICIMYRSWVIIQAPRYTVVLSNMWYGWYINSQWHTTCGSQKASCTHTAGNEMHPLGCGRRIRPPARIQMLSEPQFFVIYALIWTAFREIRVR